MIGNIGAFTHISLMSDIIPIIGFIGEYHAHSIKPIPAVVKGAKNKYRGVHKTGSKFRGRIIFNGIPYQLGQYESAFEAGAYYGK